MSQNKSLYGGFNMFSYKVCSFFGHRDIVITEELKIKTKNIIENLIKNCYAAFYFGGFGDFDNLCWEIVSELKNKYPSIKRIFCVADPRLTKISKCPSWLNYQNFEDIVYLDLNFDYWYTRIYYRNCEIIKQSDMILFYVTDTKNSGAYKALQYAKKMKKEYINIAQGN